MTWVFCVLDLEGSLLLFVGVAVSKYVPRSCDCLFLFLARHGALGGLLMCLRVLLVVVLLRGRRRRRQLPE
jgi:hypothetical protein